MKYGKIDAAGHEVSLIEAETFADAERQCGLTPGQVDHGVVAKYPDIGGLGIVVGEFSLFVPPVNQHFFALRGQLYAGNALLYAFDYYGKTIDFDDVELVPLHWFGSAQDVEQAIKRGAVIRPTIATNGKVHWEWPQPRPDIEKIIAGAI